MAAAASQPQPTLPWRTASSLLMGLTGAVSRGFLFGLNRVQVVGGERFLELLNKRRDVRTRDRGLITVSNHVSVIDDPFIWGALPLRYSFQPENHRWSLGSYDLCFTNKGLSAFFTLGQVLPTHRLLHSPYGGLFQPTMTQAIRLLSAQPYSETATLPAPTKSTPSFKSPDLADPFTSSALTYTTNGVDTFPAPSAYENRKHAWVHLFPEGRVHQTLLKTQRYFRWGVSRLILEAEPLPDIVPIFIDGMEDVMDEKRTFPRFIPRIGNSIQITFGELVDVEKVFGDLRQRWRQLVAEEKLMLQKKGMAAELSMGELTETLKYSTEAVNLRIEVAKRVRDEILKLRQSLGLPDEDTKLGLRETWLNEDTTRKYPRRS